MAERLRGISIQANLGIMTKNSATTTAQLTPANIISKNTVKKLFILRNYSSFSRVDTVVKNNAGVPFIAPNNIFIRAILVGFNYARTTDRTNPAKDLQLAFSTAPVGTTNYTSNVLQPLTTIRYGAWSPTPTSDLPNRSVSYGISRHNVALIVEKDAPIFLDIKSVPDLGSTDLTVTVEYYSG